MSFFSDFFVCNISCSSAVSVKTWLVVHQPPRGSKLDDVLSLSFSSSSTCILHHRSSCWQYSCRLNSQKSSFLSQLYENPDSGAIVKTQKRDSGRLLNSANLSESLYLWVFLELFYLFRDRRHTVSTWNETMDWMSTVYGNKSYPGVCGNKSAFMSWPLV